MAKKPAEGDVCSVCGKGKYGWYRFDAVGNLQFADRDTLGAYLECSKCPHRPGVVITEEIVAEREALARAIWRT